MCKLHTKAHKKGKKTKMHHMTPLTQYEPIMSDAVVVRECPTHKGEKLTIVCSTCDDLLICKECAIVLPHKTHDYELVRDVIDERRQNLKVIVDKTASFTTKLTQDVSIIDRMILDTQKKRDEEVYKNKHSCEILINAIKEKENDLEKELDVLFSVRINALQTEKEKWSILLTAASCSNNRIIESYADVRFMEMEREISQQHLEMHKKMNKCINPYADPFFESKVDVQVVLHHLTSWSFVSLEDDKESSPNSQLCPTSKPTECVLNATEPTKTESSESLGTTTNSNLQPLSSADTLNNASAHETFGGVGSTGSSLSGDIALFSFGLAFEENRTESQPLKSASGFGMTGFGSTPNSASSFLAGFGSSQDNTKDSTLIGFGSSFGNTNSQLQPLRSSTGFASSSGSSFSCFGSSFSGGNLSAFASNSDSAVTNSFGIPSKGLGSTGFRKNRTRSSFGANGFLQ